MPNIPIYIVDAFASRPFTGNPAAVCLLDAKAEDAWMQAVAAEMNLSETAFCWPGSGEAGDYHLTWFTPVKEVALCGHATLAASHVLWTSSMVPHSTSIRFHTRFSGTLICRRVDDQVIAIDLPLTNVTDGGPMPHLDSILGTPTVAHSLAGPDLLVELPNDRAVRDVRPDTRRIAELPYRGIIVTARSEELGFDFVSRFFAPAYGIDEDPVTGSAHCALAPYWAARLGKRSMRAYQASARGGVLGVEVVADRVVISGGTVTVVTGYVDC